MIRIVGNALYQWDTGRYVTTDIEADHIHFSNKGDSKAVIMDLSNSQAKIPDYLLQTGKQLCVYVVRDKVTVESRAFSVTLRERPADYIYEEDQRNFVYELIADAQAATEAAKQAAKEAKDVSDAIREDAASGKFKGDKGEKGDPGEQGPKGEKGDPGEGSASINDAKIGTESTWSSKNTVDKLCPAFRESGSVVVCEPIEGYPLEVVSEIPAEVGVSKITLYHSNEDDSIEYTVDFGDTYSNGTYNWASGELKTEDEGVIQFAPKVITALYGENTFHSDCGDTEVSGMADPNNYWAEKLAETKVDDTKIGTTPWSSKNTVDKLCHAFEENGYVVTCEPVEGYPLEVVSTINPKDDGSAWDSITMTHCGKNLFDFKQAPYQVTYTTKEQTYTRWGFRLHLPSGTYTIHAENALGTSKDSYIYATVNRPDGSYVSGEHTVKQGKSYGTKTVTLQDGDILFLYNALGGGTEESTTALFGTENNVQIEAGSVATAYEPYRNCGELSVDFAKMPYEVIDGRYNWTTGVLEVMGELYQHDPESNTFTYVGEDENGDDYYTTHIVRNIPATSGANYFYSDCGDTAVSGRADPRPIITKLETEVYKQYELIEEITIKEAVPTVRRYTEPSGAAYNFKAVKIIANIAKADRSETITFTVYGKNQYVLFYGAGASGSIGTSERTACCTVYNDGGFSNGSALCPTGTSSSNYVGTAFYVRPWQNVVDIAVASYISSGDGKIPVGTVIQIYAIRG